MLQQNEMCMLQTDVKKNHMHLAWTCSCRSKSCPTSALVQLLEKMHKLCMLPTYFTSNMHYPLIHLQIYQQICDKWQQQGFCHCVSQA